MKDWWRRTPTPTKAFVVVASVAFILDLVLLFLAQTKQIGFGWPAAIGLVIVVVSWIGILVVGRMNRRRKLDEVVRRARAEDEFPGADKLPAE